MSGISASQSSASRNCSGGYPGTEAAVDKHQNRTAECLSLQRQLRERHHKETEDWANRADAFIYLMGQVPQATDQALLDEFRRVTSGRTRSLNAVRVMVKIDLKPDLLSRARELVTKAADQLKERLNTIVPVSAGIRRALDRLQHNGNQALRSSSASSHGSATFRGIAK